MPETGARSLHGLGLSAPTADGDVAASPGSPATLVNGLAGHLGG